MAEAHNELSISVRDRAVGDALGRIMGRQFPAATREWAERVAIVANTAPQNTGYVIAAAQFKAWWEHNKEAVLAKDYAKATWLPSEAPPELAAIWQPPEAKTTPTSRPAPTPTAAIPPAPTGSLLPWLLGGLAALALAVVAARTLRRR
jgi:hypothetical protein